MDLAAFDYQHFGCSFKASKCQDCSILTINKGASPMENISLIAIDLAKKVFQIHAVNKSGEEVFKKQLKRNQMLNFFGQYKNTKIKVVMESSCGAHYWGRKFNEMGLDSGLIPARKVKPFLQSQKNDKNDARAIAEAGQRPAIRIIPPKTTKQLEMQSLLRARSLIMKNRIQISNHIRGLALEFGVIISEGLTSFSTEVEAVIEDADNELTPLMRGLLKSQLKVFSDLVSQENDYEKQISKYSKLDEDCNRLMTIPGVGPMISMAFIAYIGSGSQFKNGRAVAANLGVVPRQFSSGGKAKLGRISKRGDNDLRVMMMQGARSVIGRSIGKSDPNMMQKKIKEMVDKKGWGKTVVAQANYMCRVMWHLNANKEEYRAA